MQRYHEQVTWVGIHHKGANDLYRFKFKLKLALYASTYICSNKSLANNYVTKISENGLCSSHPLTRYVYLTISCSKRGITNTVFLYNIAFQEKVL